MLADAGSMGPEKVADAYLENILDIHKGIALLPGLKSELSLRDLAQDADYLRFAAFAYDLTSVYFYGGLQNSISMLNAEGFRRHLGVDQVKIAIPSSQMDVFEDPSNPVFHVGLVMRADPEAADLLNQIAPLVESGRVLIRPRRVVLVLSGREGDKQSWQTLDVASGSPFELWNIPLEKLSDSTLPAVIGESVMSESALFDITFPFLAGISFSDLASVLEDESEHIAKCRLHLRELVSRATVEKSGDLSGFIGDVVRSEIEILNRRLKAVAKIHGLKAVGVAVGSVTLSLVAASSAGWAQAITALGGAGGFAQLSSELASYFQKRSELADVPLYFLWRLKSMQNRE
jgi:hypothetical protein